MLGVARRWVHSGKLKRTPLWAQRVRADVIRRYYDKPDLDADLRRRITSFDEIDICEHSDPTDIDEELSE